MDFMGNQVQIVMRNLVAIVFLFSLTLIMGKKLVSQLNFMDSIAGITIGSIAASMAIDRTIPYASGIISLLIWSLVPLLSAWLGLKSQTARKIFDGTPTILVQNGKILEQNLKKEKYHVNDLLEELRLQNVFNIADVNYAVLETSGQISVQLLPGKQPVTLGDLNLTPPSPGLCANLIIDGQILHEHLHQVGHDETWLRDQLKSQGVESPDKVLLASLDTGGKLYVDLEEDKTRNIDILK